MVEMGLVRITLALVLAAVVFAILGVAALLDLGHLF